MRTKPCHIIFLAIIIFISSCRTYKPVSDRSATGKPDLDYIIAYKDIAINEMQRTGVPASITLAQGMIESNYGRSTLATTARNHFGIKCHNGWTGPTVRHDDDRPNECFRKYKDELESFEDHSNFLLNGSRYQFLFKLEPTDYKGWARGLKKAGYATNPEYAEMLIRKIEQNNLMLYDHEAIAGKSSKSSGTKEREIVEQDQNIIASSGFTIPARVSRIQEKNRIQYIIVKEGETREMIEKEFSLLKWELARYNELAEDFQVSPGQILFLQPKREKAEAGLNTYTVQLNETMYDISQKFGLKLKSLYELNRMESGTEPEAGKKLWLRTMKPVN